MPYDAFISYRHADAEAARAVAKLLRAFEQRVFIDDGIAVGAEWAPEIWTALSVSKKLIVLWSRSAAKSEFVHGEWSRAPAECKVFALQLDGEALPPALGKFNAITGLDVAGRLLARSVELMKGQKSSPSKAQEQLLRELAADGIVLEEKQKRALTAFLPVIAGTSWWLSGSLPTLAVASSGCLLAFGIGYLLAPGKVVIVPASPLPPRVDIYSARPTEPTKPAVPASTAPCGSGAPAAAAVKAESGAEAAQLRCQAMLDRCQHSLTESQATEATLRDQLNDRSSNPPLTKLPQATPLGVKPIVSKVVTSRAAGGAAPIP